MHFLWVSVRITLYSGTGSEHTLTCTQI